MRWNVRLLGLLLRMGAKAPLRLLHALGAAAAPLSRWLAIREFRVAQKNLALCFPESKAAERRRWLAQTLAHAGRGLTELCWLWGGDPQRSLGAILEIRGREHLDGALAQGRGVLLAAPHLGAWELLNLWLSSVAPITILYRVPQRAEYEPLLLAARSALGAESVRADPSGVRLLFRRLKQGRLLGILPDQRPKSGQGVEAPFFGVPAMTMTLLCRLAHKSGAPVVFGFAERLPRGQGFVLHFLPGEPAIADPDPLLAAAAMNRGIEALVRLAPTQYQWTYKRFSFRSEKGPDPVYGKWKRSRHGGTNPRHAAAATPAKTKR